MDINKIVRAIELKCGQVLKVIPEKDLGGSVKDYIMDTINLFTLPSFNTVFPQLVDVMVHVDQLERVNDEEGRGTIIFRFPKDIANGYNVLYIKSVVPRGSFPGPNAVNTYGVGPMMRGFGTNRYGRLGSSSLYDSAGLAILGYADAQLKGKFSQALIHKFTKPNILEINSQYSWCELFKITFGTEHDSSFLTIDDTNYDEFLKLALLDVRSNIYNNFKNFDNQQLAFGSFNLGISDWSNAEQEREEVYKEYLSTLNVRIGTLFAG